MSFPEPTGRAAAPVNPLADGEPPITGPPRSVRFVDSNESMIAIEPSVFRSLRKLNIAAGLLHLASAIAMLLLANDFSLPVTVFDTAGPPGTPVDEGTLRTSFDLPLAWGTAAFSFLSAFFHFLVAAPGVNARYDAEVRHGRNRFRWVEYSMSASLMIVLIAQLTGIYSIAALIGLVFANAAMILYGWEMEMVNPPGSPVRWRPFVFGCIAGTGPWIAIAVHLGIVLAETDEGPPTFVYGILVSIFVLFNIFAVNQFLQFKRVGPWVRSVTAERTYIGLSFVAKTALAWQIFANVLVD